jgi:NAD(P)-dependent dehydrogenase (short-subunit alcohol dehydrogenase family)
MAVQLDVTERAALAAAMDAVERELGALDVLVNNAGVAVVSGGVLNETEADWDRVLATHLHASFLISKLAATSMARRKRGKIINLEACTHTSEPGRFRPTARPRAPSCS